MRHITEERKIMEGRGTGEGKDYKPWIQCRECGGSSTCVQHPDWKHHRMMHFLSQGEFWAYLSLRWREDVLDVREQFPLRKEETMAIAKTNGIPHPNNIDHNVTMTTDLLVTYIDAHGRQYLKAYSIKNRRMEVFGDMEDEKVMRNVEKQRIEMAYWHLHAVPFENVFKEEISPVLVSNIDLVTRRYELPQKYTDSDVLHYLIARKRIVIAMDDFYIQDHMTRLLSTYKKGIDRFKHDLVQQKRHLPLV